MAPRGSRAAGGARGGGRATGGRTPAAGSRGNASGGARGGAAAGGRRPSSSGTGGTRGLGKGVARRVDATRGAGRTGRVSAPGAPERKPTKGLGGEQVEGRQAVRELLIAGNRRVYEIWIAGDVDGDESEIIGDIVELARANRVPVQQVAKRRLDMQARSEAPQGVLAKAAPLPEVELDQFLRRRPGKPPFLVAVDGVTDPGNLGALLRCCDGAGVTGVVLPRHRAVHVTPTVAKAAAGAVEHVPMALVGGLPAALARMKDAGIWVVGLDDDADRSLFELGDLTTEGICLVLGAEGAGLSRLVRERCDLIVSIPMRGRLSSLNVSAAAALACYEVTRGRL
jgi:23S rRNA (guanosine2251-2'-O)-methyltransferase